MLIDRCLMTKNKTTGEWIGVVEVKQREGEKWRFAAWIAFFIMLFEAFRLAQFTWFSFSMVEYAILFISAFATIFFFRQSSKCEMIREACIVIPQPEPIYDEAGQTLGYKRQLVLPNAETGKFERFDVSRFTHVVYGIIDYPMPGRKNVSIDAYAIYLAESDGSPHAVVEGSFDKYSSFTLARRICALTKLPLIEMGKGHPFTDSEK